MAKTWESKKDTFKVIDVRKLNNNFLPGIMKTAKQMDQGEGLCVVQTFEPKPLYLALKALGFEYQTDKISKNEYKAYFYRVKAKGKSGEKTKEVPFRPTAILNYKFVDDDLANITVDFWEHIWEKQDSAIELKDKLLLSLSNAVGARRFRQATREMIKAYALGVEVAVLDELFSLFAWNQGVGFFSSEIGPSPLFKAYKFIKKKEMQGASREEILPELMEKFGEKNPNVGTLPDK